jgi:UDP-glucuronate decarboxylase
VNKTILVTGGAGFIGSHLCKALLNEGNKVICLDNFFTGNIKNIANLKYNPNFKVVPHDITKSLIGVINDHVDEIYNLACPASPIHYQFDAIETIKASTIGIINVLDFAKLNGAKILQTSTSEIYGDPHVHPQIEGYRGNVNTLGPRACYDEGKRVSETLMMDYHRKFGLNIKIVRIFNTYGPNMDINDGRVVSNFVISALTKKPITIYGDGNQTRSFCYVSDTVEAIIKVMDSNYIGPFNVGNPDERTIRSMAESIKKMTNSNVKLITKNLPEDDPTRRNPDISLIKNKIGWVPKVSFENGLKQTIMYFEKIVNSRKRLNTSKL